MVGWREKFLKSNLLKRHKTVPKTKFGPRNKWFKISYLKFIFSFQIFWQQALKPRKTSKKDHSFYNRVFAQKTSLILLPQHSQRPYTLYKFSSKHVSDWCQKKHWQTPPFLDAQELYSWSTWKVNVCIFQYISERKLFFSFYLVRAE